MFSKRLLYFSGNQMAAYRWEAGRLSEKTLFRADQEGHNAFADYVARDTAPFYLLTDVIEEDFRQDSLPSLWGNARKTLVGRKLAQAFRATPYRHAESQRTRQGKRKELRLLLSALTNADLVKPWLDPLKASKAPLAGIYSVPLMSEILLKKLELQHIPHLLLITHQEAGGLRQSYFQAGRLKFSRLTLLSNIGASELANAVTEESARTQQYLNNLRLLPRDQPLHIHLLSQGDELRRLQAACTNQPLRTFHFISLEDACTRTGLECVAGNGASDRFFLGLLGAHAPANHYATAEETFYYRFLMARRAMRLTSILFVAAAAFYAISDGWDAADRLQGTTAILEQAVAVDQRTHAIAKTFPPLPASPQAMREAVKTAQRLRRLPFSPQDMMTAVSQAIDQSPQIQIDRFVWTPTVDPAADPANPSPDGMVRLLSLASPGAPFDVPANGAVRQAATLEGQVRPFRGYRQAAAAVTHFIATLRQAGLTATPLTMPLDTNPKDVLQGSTRAQREEAPQGKFSLRLIYPPLTPRPQP